LNKTNKTNKQTKLQARLIARLERIGATDNCTGDYGVNMFCSWNGLAFVLSAPGTWGDDHDEYIDEAFESFPAIWKFVSFHKNQRLMQIGEKSDETGWAVYDASRENGAFVATGHEHSYCRSYMMSNFQRQTIANSNATLNLKPGESFVFVSGLGGESIREWDEDLVDNDWWAAVAADDNGVSDGALLCTFNTINTRTAECEFRDTNGRTWDEFTIYSQNPETMEEHLEAMRIKRENRKKVTCADVSPFIEVPVSASSDDVFEDETGQLHCGSEVISLGKGPAALRFQGVPLKKGAVVKHAYLQVYGDVTDNALPHFVIGGSSSSPRDEKSNPLSSLVCGGNDDKSNQKTPLRQLKRDGRIARMASTQVVWEKEDENWERHTVWLSPDLKNIVQELINQDDWIEGDDILVHIHGKGNRGFYSNDYSPCFAPTLAIELENAC